CPGEAWVKRGSFCYLVSCDVGNMQYARAQCASYEATLTSVHDMNEGLFIDWLVRNEAGVDSTTCNAGHMYIGLTWEWDDGSAYDYSGWEAPEPTLPETMQQCAIITGASWINVPCHSEAGYVC
ncbi:hypothetical protein CAPTEDRAFT_68167, partial [Capitella teleta]